MIVFTITQAYNAKSVGKSANLLIYVSTGARERHIICLAGCYAFHVPWPCVRRKGISKPRMCRVLRLHHASRVKKRICYDVSRLSNA